MSNADNINAFFADYQARVQTAIARVPNILANDTVNYALKSFNNESYDGAPWPARKDKNNTRKLLVKTGKLKRSIRVINVRTNGFNVGSDVVYASVHNYGGSISKQASSETFVRNRKLKGKGKGRFARGTTPGKGFTRGAFTYNMPKRQFLGASPVLAKRLIALAKLEITNALKR